GFVRTYSDVTELRRSTEAQKDLLEAVPVPLLLARTADGALIQVNQRAAELFGLARDTVEGRDALNFYVDATDRERLVAILRLEGQI
ncbi:PAS domain-containing protein, partial [Acinetobacter baumannii]